MANSITQYAIDFIYAKISGGKVFFSSIARYKQRYELTDLADDDLITKYLLQSSFNTTFPPVPLPYPAGTTLPIVLSSFQTLYSDYGNYPTIKVQLASGAETGRDITGSATIDFDGAIPPDSLSISAMDDGTGITSEDIIIIIKQ